MIDFDERGIYFGSKGESRSDFTLWDSGGYQVVDPNRVRISTATDSQVTYAFTVSGNVLSFLTPDGCAIEYRRADR